jgi:hypothetical protein
MTSKEFIIWLKGFIAGSNNYDLTPSGWEALKSNLEQVEDDDNTLRHAYLKDSEGYESLDELENDFFGPMDDSEGNERNIDAVEEMRKYAEEEMEKRMDIIGQNGNEGLHYDNEIENYKL